ncbi:hypothetical protein H8A99_13320 [Bradyrhizobium sp. Arg68]|uniref:hypothetical protein n=1 Tax=Bradyrhizobium ivorense TaxID=2511166 RepID=UPI001E39D597|nr:hypothetical protein [Bradyrhizobium ivorense]MCC8937426.1 hypothetical protein [Bradyrhizobium ivorense]
MSDGQDPTGTVFKDKFIAFVDILGFKNMVTEAEAGRGMPLQAIIAATKDLGSRADREDMKKHGPRLCPGSTRLAPDIDFQITQISDCVVVSTETSPAGALGVVSHCWQACLALLSKGLMCRGFITRGRIFHTEDQFIGSGYHAALDGEKAVSIFRLQPDESRTPFIEVDPAVALYVKEHGDQCVRKMFDRFTESSGGLTAVFPFKRLNQSFMINDNFNADRELESLNNIRDWIREMKDKIAAGTTYADPSAVSKAAQYNRMLDAQLVACDKTELRIEVWRRAFGA